MFLALYIPLIPLLPRAGEVMDLWKEYNTGKLALPAVVQVDISGALVALPGGGFAGPYSCPDLYPGDAYFVALATAPPDEAPSPDAPIDYQSAYGQLAAAVAAINPRATKAAIVADLTEIQAGI